MHLCFKGIYMLEFHSLAVDCINEVPALRGFSNKKMYGLFAGVFLSLRGSKDTHNLTCIGCFYWPLSAFEASGKPAKSLLYAYLKMMYL